MKDPSGIIEMYWIWGAFLGMLVSLSNKLGLCDRVSLGASSF
jgi:hypothetical protein